MRASAFAEALADEERPKGSPRCSGQLWDHELLLAKRGLDLATGLLNNEPQPELFT